MDSLLLNIKSNWIILQIDALIKANDPSQDLSRTAVFEDAHGSSMCRTAADKNITCRLEKRQ